MASRQPPPGPSSPHPQLSSGSGTGGLCRRHRQTLPGHQRPQRATHNHRHLPTDAHLPGRAPSSNRPSLTTALAVCQPTSSSTSPQQASNSPQPAGPGHPASGEIVVSTARHIAASNTIAHIHRRPGRAADPAPAQPGLGGLKLSLASAIQHGLLADLLFSVFALLATLFFQDQPLTPRFEEEADEAKRPIREYSSIGHTDDRPACARGTLPLAEHPSRKPLQASSRENSSLLPSAPVHPLQASTSACLSPSSLPLRAVPEHQ